MKKHLPFAHTQSLKDLKASVSEAGIKHITTSVHRRWKSFGDEILTDHNPTHTARTENQWVNDPSGLNHLLPSHFSSEKHKGTN